MEFYKKLLLGVLILFLAAAIFNGIQKSNEPQIVTFTVKNLFNVELGNISVTYKPPITNYTQACEIATLAATQTSLQRFKCTGYNKEGENWQIVYQPMEESIYIFTIDEKLKIISINIGQTT